MTHISNETENANTLQVTEVELVYRNNVKSSERKQVTGSYTAYDLFLNTWNMDTIELQEQFKVMLLDRKNSCIGISTVGLGGISSCVVDLRIVFATALKARATSIILAHNHPSGSKSPSEDDKRLTNRFAEAGKLLDISVFDHLIITKEGYTSFSDEGLLFSQKMKPVF